jgi:hypothetical protein
MAVNNKDTNGYSDALGGYGVPAQVELTAKSAAEGKSPGRKPASIPSKKLIIIIVAVAVVAVLIALAVNGVFAFPNQYAENIASIEKQQQNSNGAEVTNYLPLLAEDVDWVNIDEKTREGIAKYAVETALDQAETDQAGIFNIMGMTYDRNTPIFLYSVAGEQQKVQIMVDGKVAGEVTIK